VTVLVAVHTPLAHADVAAQRFPLLAHAVPSGAGGLEHCPVVASQEPATWQASLAPQTIGFEPAHVPAAHVYAWKHGLLPVHEEPSVAFGLEHVPVVGSQVPAAWHWSSAVQATGFEPLHVPLWQVSLCVHALPSLQTVPFEEAGFEHVPELGSHVPAAWH
jgi:hypothetical protein